MVLSRTLRHQYNWQPWFAGFSSYQISHVTINRGRNLLIKWQVISQLVLQSFKTNRQVNYVSKADSNCSMSNTLETPLSIGLGLYMHKKIRSEELVNMLYNLNLSASYDKISSIKYDAARAVEFQSNFSQTRHWGSLRLPTCMFYLRCSKQLGST